MYQAETMASSTPLPQATPGDLAEGLCLTDALSGKVEWVQPSGPRRPGEGTDEEQQGIISIDQTAQGGLLIRVTLLAAGFLIGPAGMSVREVGRRTTADIKSWTDNKANGVRSSRVFLIQGAPAAVQQAALIICSAVRRYKELAEGASKGQQVSRLQNVHGVEFSYHPPPKRKVPNAATIVGRALRPADLEKPFMVSRNVSGRATPPHHSASFSGSHSMPGSPVDAETSMKLQAMQQQLYSNYRWPPAGPSPVRYPSQDRVTAFTHSQPGSPTRPPIIGRAAYPQSISMPRGILRNGSDLYQAPDVNGVPDHLALNLLPGQVPPAGAGEQYEQYPQAPLSHSISSQQLAAAMASQGYQFTAPYPLAQQAAQAGAPAYPGMSDDTSAAIAALLQHTQASMGGSTQLNQLPVQAQAPLMQEAMPSACFGMSPEQQRLQDLFSEIAQLTLQHSSRQVGTPPSLGAPPAMVPSSLPNRAYGSLNDLPSDWRRIQALESPAAVTP